MAFEAVIYENAVSEAYYSIYNTVMSLFFKCGIKCENHSAAVILIKDLFHLNELYVLFLEYKKDRIDNQYYLPVVGTEPINKEKCIERIAIAQIFLILILAFFILKDWKSIFKKIYYLLPMRAKTKNRLVKEFGNIAHTVIYAQLFVAFVQGIVATIGFYIFGVPLPILLGIVVAFCALIPTIGTVMVWVPASFFLIINCYFSHDYWLLGKGIGLFIYGILVISTIDNILLVKIVQAKTNISPIVTILGVIGGVSMFGIPGIFIGPILLPLMMTYFETFKERFK